MGSAFARSAGDMAPLVPSKPLPPGSRSVGDESVGVTEHEFAGAFAICRLCGCDGALAGGLGDPAQAKPTCESYRAWAATLPPHAPPKPPKPRKRIEAKTFEVLIPINGAEVLLLKARLFLDGGKVVGVRSLRLSQMDGGGIKTFVSGVEYFEDIS
jgi:hypothetical protein